MPCACCGAVKIYSRNTNISLYRSFAFCEHSLHQAKKPKRTESKVQISQHIQTQLDAIRAENTRLQIAARQGGIASPAKFEGYDTEGLAVYSNVVLS